MKKIVKGALCAGLALTMCAAVGCTKQQLDPETRHLKLAVGALDGNFNPFTYTSANDGEMISMTQLSLLTINDEGKIIYGENEVCAALDMKTILKDAHGNVLDNKQGDINGTTEYEITLKKGIMYSDGVHELTIKDVLFNLYVYLDPAYTGSTTIYSTDIVGMAAYRTQNPGADKNSPSIDSTLDVDGRIDAIVRWSDDESVESTDQIDKDVALAQKLFEEEIASDWTSIYGGWEDSYKAYRFTEAWQAYLFAEGLIQVQEKNNAATQSTSPIYYDADGDNKFDANKGDYYYTTLDPWQQGAVGASENAIANGERGAQHFIDLIEQATTDEKVNEYIAANEDATKDAAIVALQREACLERVNANYTSRKQMQNVVQYWATASKLYDAILGELRTAYYQKLKDENNGELLVKNISGITTYKNANGNDVLKIVINGIDPKAEYNWAFPIAPLYYYSGVYNNKDYVAAAMNDTKNEEFGLDFGNSDFFNKVISDTEKNGVPVGAGAYKASTRMGGDNPTKATFNVNTSNCYFKRNDYFETVGEKIENAKINLIHYAVYSDAKIMQALESGEIDFGKPNATKDNVNLVSQKRDKLTSVDYDTGGYGYIGINPKAVPEYKVRQAIMKAIDTSFAVDFYGSKLASPITRPMSTTSWAYPDPKPGEYPAIAYDKTSDSSEIKQLMTEAGYVYENGLYRKRYQRDGMANASNNSTVKLTFTIAGESTEHPAYLMFTSAAERLNSLGFDITVTTNPNALKSLITGDLDVWAAAWTSSSDPDMYQIFHKDSNATSVNNWNYKNIIKDQYTWSHEYGIIEELSEKIDEARTVLAWEQRAPIYSRCLDLVMDLAVELPTYQRHDLCVYNHKVINSKSLVLKPNNYIGLFDEIWNIEYV